MQYVKKYWWVALAAILVVPYLAFQNMRARKARDNPEVVYKLDDRVPDVYLVMDGHDTYVRYQNNTAVITDGIGIAVLTWDDMKANPERLSKAGYKPDEKDFPVVVFFNQSGFDATGDPAVVHRAKDGSVVFEVKDKPPGRLRQVVALPDGSWTAYFWNTVDPVSVSADDFYRLYLGVEPPQPPKKFSQEELDKMSPEDLQKNGIKRLSKDEYLKQAKTGVRGEVIKVGGREKAVEKLSGVKIYALKGKVEPVDKLEDKDPRIVGVDKTNPEGVFTIPLSPGQYTLVVEQDGKFYGNSYRGDRWPTVTVKDAWIEYEFRRGN